MWTCPPSAWMTIRAPPPLSRPASFRFSLPPESTAIGNVVRTLPQMDEAWIEQ